MRRGLLMGGAAWLGAIIVAALGGGDAGDALSPRFLLLCLLLILAPLSIALPAGRALAAPGWMLETTIAWAALGYLLACTDPESLGRGPALFLVLPALGGALASPALPLAALWPAANPRLVRAQSYLLAGAGCGLVLLRALGAANLPIVALLLLLAIVAEVLLLTGLRAAPAGDSAESVAPAPAHTPEPTARAIPATTAPARRPLARPAL